MHECFYCGKVYQQERDMETCIESHDLLYVPISKGDINRLAHFIMTRDTELLTDNLVNTIFRYMRRGK